MLNDTFGTTKTYLSSLFPISFVNILKNRTELNNSGRIVYNIKYQTDKNAHD